MTRDLGDYHTGGFMHDRIRQAAMDCRDGREEATRLLSEVLTVLYPYAYACASVEACDATMIDCIDMIRESIDDTAFALAKARAKLG